MVKPIMDSSPSDIQQLFRAHVHEKRILKGNVRDLEKQTTNTIKYLSAESRHFQNKFSKYLTGRRRNSIHDLPEHLKSSKDGETNKSITRDMVCKECPYSFRTWSNLVDVDRQEIDCYKSEILYGDSKKNKPTGKGKGKVHLEVKQTGHSGMVTEISGFRPNGRLSASASALVGNSLVKADMSGLSPRSERSREMADLRKFSTVSRKPNEVNDFKFTVTDLGDTKTHVPTIKASSGENMNSLAETNYCQTTTSPDKLGTFEAEFHRGRSHTIDNHSRPVLLQRRKALENKLNDNYIDHRSTMDLVTLKVMADHAKGLKKFKYLSRLLKDLPLSWLTDDKTTQGNDPKNADSLPDIFESVKNCRYLRSPPISRKGSIADLTDEERYKWS